SPIVRGQVNFVQIKTFFDAAWDELDKTYQFKNGDNVVEIASNDEIVDLPFEASEYPGALEITVIGTKLDVDGVTVLKKATVNSLRYKVACNNASDDADNVGDITPTLVEQIRQIAETAEDKAEEAERISAIIWEAYEKGELNGKDGVVGRDGVSPTVETAQTSNGATITITDANGPHIIELLNGKDGTMSFTDLTEAQKESLKGDPGVDGKDGVDGKNGVDGKDGVSPTVSTKQTSTGTDVTITDVKGAHTFTVLNGKDGKDGTAGKDGAAGPSGADGYSPTVTVTQTATGATITTTDKNGTTTANIFNGKDGEGGGIAELPIATSDTLGGIKVGDGLEITDDGILSAVGGTNGGRTFGKWTVAGSSNPDGVSAMVATPNELNTMRSSESGNPIFEAGKTYMASVFVNAVNYSTVNGRLSLSIEVDSTSYGLAYILPVHLNYGTTPTMMYLPFIGGYDEDKEGFIKGVVSGTVSRDVTAYTIDILVEELSGNDGGVSGDGITLEEMQNYVDNAIGGALNGSY
ncbi:MAG: hypothetical protein J6Q89_08885, partial [Clostridia bacterium]|nr:hypothetical protein [Clostridia bacterium]